MSASSWDLIHSSSCSGVKGVSGSISCFSRSLAIASAAFTRDARRRASAPKALFSCQRAAARHNTPTVPETSNLKGGREAMRVQTSPSHQERVVKLPLSLVPSSLPGLARYTRPPVSILLPSCCCHRGEAFAPAVASCMVKSPSSPTPRIPSPRTSLPAMRILVPLVVLQSPWTSAISSGSRSAEARAAIMSTAATSPMPMLGWLRWKRAKVRSSFSSEYLSSETSFEASSSSVMDSTSAQ
mmetsp:Transcript_51491/g.122451  ORF Transcript_51491/g.122451 Transcript_51491/m.122451 type:complete len:241 (+) Transcript_51491:188-910(+)